jgi:hypothetical protein
MKGDIKAGKGPLIAAAGEYLVTGELLRRGWIAGLTPRGTADFDVVAIKKEWSIRVRVKTKTVNSKLFRWNRVDGKAFREPLGEDDFCILVELASEHDIPEYFITRTRDVQKKLNDNFDKWLKAKPGRDRNNPVIGIVRGRKEDEEWLSPLKDRWAVLELSRVILTADGDSRPPAATSLGNRSV